MKSGKIKLVAILESHAPLAVALSGGVDSAFLLAMAKQILGDQVIAMTSVSPLHARRDLADAESIAASLSVPHVAVDTGPLEAPGFVLNTKNRCYICKRLLWKEFLNKAGERGIDYVADGLCLDDLDEFRPGIAAGRELGIVSPLADAGLTKAEIRALSKTMGLFTWDKPSGTCLATRIPTGTPITRQRLAMIEQAETVLSGHGFRQCRVRLHGTTARIEVPSDDIEALMTPGTRQSVGAALLKIGFTRVSADLTGYGES
ncbi:MAG: ATP-dependent sacrificial sulfur transferase LarE [Thermodesulfobacteriota bacterium]|nr:ATP-dependent sacrificial sulfur transferase LarE [Thermodesulfobacteriota bacterium]